MIVGKGKGENNICMDNYFQNIFPKISGSQEDNQISIFDCPHSFLGRRGHEDTQILLPWIYMQGSVSQSLRLGPVF